MPINLKCCDNHQKNNALPKSPIVFAENFSVAFDGNFALQNLNFSIEKGEYVGIIGPNGAGKSTLLKSILGLQKPTSGKIFAPKKSEIGFVPQKILKNSSLPVSVAEMLATGFVDFSIFERKKNTQKMTETLEMVGISSDFLRKNFFELSGGQAQRVIIARALLKNPTLLLFDEPLSSVDLSAKIQIYNMLSDIHDRNNLTILFVSHEIEHITARCHRVLCLHTTLHHHCHPMDFATGKRDTVLVHHHCDLAE